MDSELIDILKTCLKFTDRQIEQINSNTSFYLYRKNPKLLYNLLINYEFLYQKKYSTYPDDDQKLKKTCDEAHECVRKAITNNPLIMYYSPEYLREKWDNFAKIVIPNNDDLTNPFHLSDKMLTDLLLGESNILKDNANKINLQLERIAKFGYTKKQLINIIKYNPTILIKNIEDLKKRFYSIVEYGYNKNDVLKMTTKVADLYNFPDERVENRFLILSAIGLHDAPIATPYVLRQSSHTTYARYRYFIDNNIEVTLDNYADLFAVEKAFAKKYGISSNRLTKIYKFKQFEREKEKIFTNH